MLRRSGSDQATRMKRGSTLYRIGTTFPYYLTKYENGYGKFNVDVLVYYDAQKSEYQVYPKEPVPEGFDKITEIIKNGEGPLRIDKNSQNKVVVFSQTIDEMFQEPDGYVTRHAEDAADNMNRSQQYTVNGIRHEGGTAYVDVTVNPIRPIDNVTINTTLADAGTVNIATTTTAGERPSTITTVRPWATGGEHIHTGYAHVAGINVVTSPLIPDDRVYVVGDGNAATAIIRPAFTLRDDSPESIEALREYIEQNTIITETAARTPQTQVDILEEMIGSLDDILVLSEEIRYPENDVATSEDLLLEYQRHIANRFGVPRELLRDVTIRTDAIDMTDGTYTRLQR